MGSLIRSSRTAALCHTSCGSRSCCKASRLNQGINYLQSGNTPSWKIPMYLRKSRCDENPGYCQHCDEVCPCLQYTICTFLTYPCTAIVAAQNSRLVLVPSELPRPKGDVPLPPALSLKESALPDGATQMTVPWPLNVEELKALLGNDRLNTYRVVHLTNATKVCPMGPRSHHDQHIS